MAKIEIGLQLGLSVSKQAKLCLVTKRCGVVVAKDISNWTSRFEWETSVWHHEPIALIGTCANFRPVYLDKNDQWTTCCCYNKESIWCAFIQTENEQSFLFPSPPVSTRSSKMCWNKKTESFIAFFPAIKCRTCMRTFSSARRSSCWGVFFPINSPLFITFLTFFCTKENVMTRQSKIEIWLITNKCLSPGCTITCNVMRSRNN